MKCVIPGSNIKVFGRAVHTLARIGDELYVEPATDSVSLRTVNATRSAYSAITFQRAFFSRYQPSWQQQQQQQQPVRCKLTVRSCLAVFRSLAALEKSVESCTLTLDDPNSRLTVHMECKHRVNKTYHIGFIECDTLQAVYSADYSVNRLRATSRLLHEAVLNFHTSQEEVTLSLTRQQIGIRNYVSDQPDAAGAVHTALSLSPGEFELCSVGAECEVTFCLRELRAVLQLTESVGAPLTLSFDTPGKPIVFCVSCAEAFEGHFVLATLADRGQECPAGRQQAAAETRQQQQQQQVQSRVEPSPGRVSSSSSRAEQPSTDRANPLQPVCASMPGVPERTAAAAAAAEDGCPAEPAAAAAAAAVEPSPPAKRARFTFQRCFNATLEPGQLNGHHRVLVPDSDSD